MKALVGAFNQEKALVGAFSVIVQLRLKHYNLSCYRGHGTLGGEQQVWLAAGQRHQQTVVLERDPPEAGAGHRGGLHREPEGAGSISRDHSSLSTVYTPPVLLSSSTDSVQSHSLL